MHITSAKSDEYAYLIIWRAHADNLDERDYLKKKLVVRCREIYHEVQRIASPEPSSYLPLLMEIVHHGNCCIRSNETKCLDLSGRLFYYWASNLKDGTVQHIRELLRRNKRWSRQISKSFRKKSIN